MAEAFNDLTLPAAKAVLTIEFDELLEALVATPLVLKHGPAYEVLSETGLDDGFDASPALVGGEIYLRGFRYLYRISAP